MKNKILFVVCLLYGLLYINSGLNKFSQYMPVPDNLPEDLIKVMTAFMEIGWLIPLVAVIEILAGLLLIIPKYRALGAIMIFPVTIGIVVTHITMQEGLLIAFIILAVNLWVIIENRAKYLPMIR
jgi:putative oxidoreductase